MNTTHPNPSHDLNTQLKHLCEHLSHILPSQASIRDFVHHNTLHGFQHLPFPEALKAAREITGAFGYLPAAKYREYFQRGRIDLEDLTYVLHHDASIHTDQIIATFGERKLNALEIYRTAMIHPIEPITQRQLLWQMEARHALSTFQFDLPSNQRKQLETRFNESGYNDLAEALTDLWKACTEVLHINQVPLHPEALLERTPPMGTQPDPQLRQQALHHLQQLIKAVGEKKTLRKLLLELVGVDILRDMRPVLLRYLGSWLDQGVASWTEEDADNGFYRAWKRLASTDLAWLMNDMPDWAEHLESLPDNAMDTIEAELQRLDIPRIHWMDYLEHLATELPGWAGMVLWRHQRPHYENLPRTINMIDYLAVRLVLEHLFARRVCREHWKIEANLGALRTHIHRHPIEMWVHYYAYSGDMPEYLQIIAQQHLSRQREQHVESVWHAIAHHIWHWQEQHQAQIAQQYGHQVNHQGWRLFRLAQHLGLTPAEVRTLTLEQLNQLFICLDYLTDEQIGYLWLQAFERHYREWIFSALSRNSVSSTPERKQAQLIFCMDDREEGFRRHLEEINPHLETFGAAAFFNLPMQWQGVDDSKAVKLCPVPVTPVHVIDEVPAESVSPAQLATHQQHLKQHRFWQDKLHQITRSQLVLGTISALASAPAALGVLLGKSFEPRAYGQWVKGIGQRFDQPITTRLSISANQVDNERSNTQPQHGFTLEEQTQIVGDFLRDHGLTKNFAPLVVMMGHYSSNQNNPHQAAYGCGACSGRYSGPNARTFAAMANQPQVRERLVSQGINIPADCWFIGAEHDTCNEVLTWFDSDLIPSTHQAAFENLKSDLDKASQHSAHERCRKLMSAPRNPTPAQAWKHMIGRSMDFSQPRPELGHATNAIALIGRRAMSRGIFLDRRSFLISYNYASDPEGKLLERILLSVGPVGAGINLEYYFSMVSNNRYGAGSKVTHNLTGLLGVMEGASSDLRTGLPKQMIEIHEAMRLLLVLEALPDLVTQIYQRQPLIQQLVGNEWVQLAVKDPIENVIYSFDPKSGFSRWLNPAQPLATVKRSADWYSGHSDHLPPAFIQVEDSTHA